MSKKEQAEITKLQVMNGELYQELKEAYQVIEVLESELASLKDFTQNQGWLHKGLRELREGREQGDDLL